ncbi:hypothetical protein Vau01_110110 [Virgisporangium aurantiacum]|uniref:Uncharacterized protein n=1 Tax=Virgisporangium aurantiacum TaxID=175570 RepID=A0A8J3ZK92_9ACTN|nr:hypothetical protein Vau01_110110 [Virgisporangium aurantiacum]
MPEWKESTQKLRHCSAEVPLAEGSPTTGGAGTGATDPVVTNVAAATTTPALKRRIEGSVRPDTRDLNSAGGQPAIAAPTSSPSPKPYRSNHLNGHTTPPADPHTARSAADQDAFAALPLRLER